MRGFWILWYSASRMFRSIHEMEGVPSLWEELIVLLPADDIDTARALAEQQGKEHEHLFRVATPVPHGVRIVFVAIERLCEVDAAVLQKGGEVFSRFLRESEALSLMQPLE